MLTKQWIAGAALTALLGSGLVLAQSPAQTAPGAGEYETGTAVITPPSGLITTEQAAALSRQNPLVDTYSYGALLQDNVGLPVLLAGQHDMTQVLPFEEPEGLGFGFAGGSSSATFPPDCTMGVGPAQIVVGTNADFRIYGKSTGSLNSSSSWPSFFAGVQPAGTFTTDPKIIYDHDSQRWFVMILAIRSSDFYSWYLIAVSDDNNPNGTWKRYAIDSTLNNQSASTTWSDYPGLGASSEAIYVTANMFDRNTGFYQYVKIRVFPKQQLLDFENTLTYGDIFNINDPAGGKAFTIQPAQHWGTPQAPFLVSSNAAADRVSVYGVNNPLGPPSLTARAVVVSGFGDPPNAEQQGGSALLDSIDARVYNAAWRNNRLYTAHSINVSSQAAVRWYALNTSAWPTTPTIALTGNIADASRNQWMPSIAVNQDDSVAVGFSRSGTAEFASIYYASRIASDPNGFMSSPQLITAGTKYYSGEGGGVLRWGDYTATIVDPVDDRTFWHFNQYSGPGGGSTWATRVQSFTIEQTWILDVTSTGASSVDVVVSPADLNGDADGVTNFSRVYLDDAVVILGAEKEPASNFGIFAWQVNGVTQPPGNGLVLTMDADKTANAIYKPVYSLTVTSSPLGNVPITVSPADFDSAGNGSTPFVRRYLDDSLVTLTAPATADGQTFVQWITNAGAQPLGQTSIIVDMQSADLAVAIYEPPVVGCPGDLNGDSMVDQSDLNLVLADFGCLSGCSGDLDGDDDTDQSDLNVLLANFMAVCP